MKPTQEQALAWAREAKFEVDENHDVWITDGYWLKELERFAAIAYEAGRKDEREWREHKDLHISFGELLEKAAAQGDKND